MMFDDCTRCIPPPVRRVLASVAAVLVLGTPSGASVLYNEALSGDFSNSGTAPTVLPELPEGGCWVAGTMGQDAEGALDPDFFIFTVPSGLVLFGLTMDEFVPATGDTGALGSFVALAIGSSIATDYPLNHLSNALVNEPGDVLGVLSQGAMFGGAPPFATPLPAGTYTLWFQETADQVRYQFSFMTTPVPEPSAAALGLMTAAGLLGRRRRAGQ